MKIKKTFFAFALLFVFSLSKAFPFSFDFSVASPAPLFVTDYKSRADFFWSSEIPGSFSCNSFLIWFLSLQPAFGVNVPLFSGEAGIRYFYSLGFHTAEISYDFPVLAEKLTLYRDFVLFLEPSFSAGYCGGRLCWFRKGRRSCFVRSAVLPCFRVSENRPFALRESRI